MTKLNVGFDFSLEKFSQEGLRVFLCAMSGGGKSYAAKVLCEELYSAGYPLIIIDPEGEYASLQELFPTIVIGGSFADIPLTEAIIQQTILTVLTTKKPLIAIYDLNLLLPSERNHMAAIIQEKLFSAASKHRRPLFFIVEECQLIAPQMLQKGQDAKVIDLSIDIAKRGRKRGINSIWITQRPADVTKRVITQCNLWLFGRLVHTTDLDQIKDFLKNASITKTEVMKLQNQFFLYDAKETNLVKFRTLKIKDLAETPSLGATIELERTKDRSLESIIKDLVLQAQQEQVKQKAREDKLLKLEQQAERLKQRLQERNDRIKQLEHDLEVIGTIRVVSSGSDNEELQKVLTERRTLEREKKSLEKQFTDLQQQYEVLADTIDQQTQFSRFKDKLQQKLQDVLDLVESLDLKEKTAKAIERPTSLETISTSTDERVEFIRHPAIKKEIQEVISKGISSKAVKGIFALLAQREEATYEQVRRSLGYSDKTMISKACKRLADRKLILQSKLQSGQYSIRLNTEGLREVIELQDARKKGEEAIAEIFKEDLD